MGCFCQKNGNDKTLDVNKLTYDNEEMSKQNNEEAQPMGTKSLLEIIKDDKPEDKDKEKNGTGHQEHTRKGKTIRNHKRF